MADKRQDFLWIVQTIILTRGQKTVGLMGVIGDAVAASHRIPRDMTARDAALDFCGFMLDELKNVAEENGEERTCPDWFAMLQDPAQSVYETRGLRAV